MLTIFAKWSTIVAWDGSQICSTEAVEINTSIYMSFREAPSSQLPSTSSNNVWNMVTVNNKVTKTRKIPEKCAEHVQSQK